MIIIRIWSYILHTCSSLTTDICVDPVPDPLVLGSSGALQCSTQLEAKSIQWLDSLNNILAETTTGEKSLNYFVPGKH